MTALGFMQIDTPQSVPTKRILSVQRNALIPSTPGIGVNVTTNRLCASRFWRGCSFCGPGLRPCSTV
jgi:hypothetical protein